MRGGLEPWLAIAAMAALTAACSAEPAEDASPTNDAAVLNEDAGSPAAPTPPDRPAPPAEANQSAGPAAAVIPAALRGRWGLVPADCTSTRGDAKGLLTISDTELRFYESRGTLRDVAESDSSRIVADFDFMGEGQTWQRRMTLDVEDNGDTLIRRESGADAMPGALRYTRCEA